MTDKQPPAQFDWATELSDAQGRVTLSEQEAKEIGARLRSMGAEKETLTLYKSLADEYGLSIFKDLKDLTTEIENLRGKLKTYEDLGDAGSDVQLLRMGYAAARLEIESLNAQLHAAKQINAAQFGLLAASIPGSALPGK